MAGFSHSAGSQTPLALQLGGQSLGQVTQVSPAAGLQMPLLLQGQGPVQSAGHVHAVSGPVQQPSPQASAVQSAGQVHLVSPRSQTPLLQLPQTGLATHRDCGEQPS